MGGQLSRRVKRQQPRRVKNIAIRRAQRKVMQARQAALRGGMPTKRDASQMSNLQSMPSMPTKRQDQGKVRLFTAGKQTWLDVAAQQARSLSKVVELAEQDSTTDRIDIATMFDAKQLGLFGSYVQDGNQDQFAMLSFTDLVSMFKAVCHLECSQLEVVLAKLMFDKACGYFIRDQKDLDFKLYKKRHKAAKSDVEQAHDDLSAKVPWLEDRLAYQPGTLQVLAWLYIQAECVAKHIETLIGRAKFAMRCDGHSEILGVKPSNFDVRLKPFTQGLAFGYRRSFPKNVAVDVLVTRKNADIIAARSLASYVYCESPGSANRGATSRNREAKTLTVVNNTRQLALGSINDDDVFVKYSRCGLFVYIVFDATPVVVDLEAMSAKHITAELLYGENASVSVKAYDEFIASRACDVDNDALVVGVKNQLVFVFHENKGKVVFLPEVTS